MSLSGSGNIASEANQVCMKRTEEFFQKIYQQVATGIAITDWQGVFQECNPAYCALLGYTEEELRTIDFASLVHPEDREANLVQVRRLQIGEISSFDIENRYVHKNGEPVWVHKFVSVLHGEEGEPTHLIALVTNITERKLADEVRLRHSVIVESSDDAIIGTDINGTVTDWNKGAEKVFGYTGQEAVGRNISFLSPADRSEDGLNMLKKVLDGEAVKQYEALRRRKDGTLIGVSITLSPTVGADGKIVGASGIGRDITERRRAETAIRESEVRYRRIVETTNEGVWLLDSKLHNSYVNRQMAKMLGYEPEEMVGRSVFDFYFPEDVERKKRLLSRRQQGVREQLEERLRRRDGLQLWVRMAATPVFKDNGEFDGALAMVCDITERKIVEEALRESEARFRLVANASPVLIWMSGTDKLCDYFNDPWLQFTGRSLDQELGNGWAESVHPDDLQRCLETYMTAFDRRESFEMEYRLRRYDGQYRWVYDKGIPRLNSNGAFAGYIGACTDITEHKLAEETLASVSGRLSEAQDQERARIARELHDDISQRLALVAMDLDSQKQNPLATTEELRAAIGATYKRISDLVSDIHAMSHRLHSSKLDSVGLAAAATGFCRELSERQKVRIEFSSGGIPKKVPEAISLCLFRVLQEALQNALKHSGAKQFQVSLLGSENEIQLTICDKGCGFDPDQTLKGTGLGLTSMKERLKLVGGELSIDTQLQRGTTIYARVPLRPRSKTASAGTEVSQST